ncbi:MAG: hypothetical protein U1F36_12540 [Planctomycetota bacterium]
MKRAVLLLSALFAACAANAQDPPVPDQNALREQAFAAERRGDHSTAADTFLQLAKLEPNDPGWVNRAADNLGRAGRIDEALDLLQPARKRFPDALELRAMLARSFALKGDALRMQSGRNSTVQLYYEDAVRTGKEVLAIDARNLDARIVVASSLLELGEAEEAEATARIAVEQSPSNYSTNALLGRITYERFVAARRDLQDAGEDTRDALRKLAEQTRTSAEAALESAHKADPARSYPLAALGDVAAWSGDLDKAASRYGEALALDPWAKVNHPWIRSAYDGKRRGEIYGGARATYAARADAKPAGTALLQWYEGQSAFDAASAADLSSEDRRALWTKAGDLFESTLTPLPDYIDTWWWLMQARYWQGDTAGATKAATAFAKSNPRRFADMVRGDEDTVSMLVGIAAKQYESDRIVESRDLNLVIAYARNTADAWNNYAFLCRETKAFQDSLTGYERALQIEPDSPQLLNDCAVILHYHLASADNLERARGMYQKAIELAQSQLDAGGLDADHKNRVQTALRDARNNLAAFERKR